MIYFHLKRYTFLYKSNRRLKLNYPVNRPVERSCCTETPERKVSSSRSRWTVERSRRSRWGLRPRKSGSCNWLHTRRNQLRIHLRIHLRSRLRIRLRVLFTSIERMIRRVTLLHSTKAAHSVFQPKTRKFQVSNLKNETGGHLIRYKPFRRPFLVSS